MRAQDFATSHAINTCNEYQGNTFATYNVKETDCMTESTSPSILFLFIHSLRLY